MIDVEFDQMSIEVTGDSARKEPTPPPPRRAERPLDLLALRRAQERLRTHEARLRAF